MTTIDDTKGTSHKTTTLTLSLGSVYAEQLAKKMDRDIMELLMGKPRPKPEPLTKYQKIKLFLTKPRRPGEWITRKLMKHYDIYEGDLL